MQAVIGARWRLIQAGFVTCSQLVRLLELKVAEKYDALCCGSRVNLQATTYRTITMFSERPVDDWIALFVLGCLPLRSGMVALITPASLIPACATAKRRWRAPLTELSHAASRDGVV